MTDRIVFSQDVPGEREWLLQQFPGFTSLETEFGGNWPSAYPTESNQSLIWEIPPDSELALEQVQGLTYRSVFTSDKFLDKRWCHSDHILSKLNFESQPKSSTAWVLHFPRSGTVFLESILSAHGGYQRVLPHAGPDADDAKNLKIYETLQANRPDVYLNYRKDWWGFTTSMLIAQHTNYYHYNTAPDWRDVQPFTASVQELDQVEHMAMSTWNFLCSTRTMFPNLNFYIYEFDDLIQHRTLTSHRAIDYSKQSLIKNYNELEQVFNAQYLDRFVQYQNRCLRHLNEMACQTLKNFDNFDVVLSKI